MVDDGLCHILNLSMCLFFAFLVYLYQWRFNSRLGVRDHPVGIGMNLHGCISSFDVDVVSHVVNFQSAIYVNYDIYIKLLAVLKK